MIRYIKTHKEVLYFALWAAFGIFYFISEHAFTLHYHTVWMPADDKIPFIKQFIIPYIIWYAYIPLGLLAVYLTDRKAMTKQAWILFPGILLCTLMFIIYPTRIDLRPVLTGKDLFTRLCLLIYHSEDSVNVFPSLHCYEACAFHLSDFVSGPQKKKTGWRIVSAVLTVLICLSTVFVKQHSVADSVVGCLLALLAFAVVNTVYHFREVKL